VSAKVPLVTAYILLMSDQDQLRNRSARLLAMALKAREDGHLDYADRLTQRAAEILEPSTALERLGTQRDRPRGAVMQLDSTITCPKCGHQAIETMPTDACQFFYNCKACNERLKPKPGDCCVFCSYGSVPCPPMQAEHATSCCAT
jgi:hypothetical protein